MWYHFSMEQKKHSSLAQGVKWFDDWFAIETILPGLHAIGEPNHHFRNWSYLIEGKQTALLFDSGTGFRNIAPVIDHLTKKPLIVLPSHLHFDHVGNLDRFPTIALADLPMLSALDHNGIVRENPDLFLGATENQAWPRFSASHWFKIDEAFDLGGRTLDVLHTPGHSPESPSLPRSPRSTRCRTRHTPSADTTTRPSSARRFLCLRYRWFLPMPFATGSPYRIHSTAETCESAS